MSASAFAKALPISLSSRTIFVKCSPAPTSFSERRAVLKAISSHVSEVEVFKKFEDHSSFIAVMSSPERANELLKESPLKRKILKQGVSASLSFATTSWGTAFRSSITEPINLVPESTETPAGDALDLSSKTLTIHIFPANDGLDHSQRALSRYPLAGPWPDGFGRDTFMTAALRKIIPGGPMADGLCDWETGNQMRGGETVMSQDSAARLVQHQNDNIDYIRERWRRSEAQKAVPNVMRSLQAVYETSSVDHNEEKNWKSPYWQRNSYSSGRDEATPVSRREQPRNYNGYIKSNLGNITAAKHAPQTDTSRGGGWVSLLESFDSPSAKGNGSGVQSRDNGAAQTRAETPAPEEKKSAWSRLWDDLGNVKEPPNSKKLKINETITPDNFYAAFRQPDDKTVAPGKKQSSAKQPQK